MNTQQNLAVPHLKMLLCGVLGGMLSRYISVEIYGAMHYPFVLVNYAYLVSLLHIYTHRKKISVLALPESVNLV